MYDLMLVAAKLAAEANVSKVGCSKATIIKRVCIMVYCAATKHCYFWPNLYACEVEAGVEGSYTCVLFLKKVSVYCYLDL